MDGRCSVETALDFGILETSSPQCVKLCPGTDVYICCGGADVHVYSCEDNRLKAVLQFPGPVTDLLVSEDEQLLYALCTSGVYCVSSSCLTPRSSTDAITVVDITGESLVVEEEFGSSLLLVGASLLVLSLRASSWLLTLYQTSEHPSRYEELRTFKLPTLSDAFDGDSVIPRRPVLRCVHSGDGRSPAPSTEVQIEPLLFKHLFGIDATLTKTPVVLCGLPDGRLCSAPLRLPGSQMKVLHTLEQPVVYFGSCDARPAGCLVAAGAAGRVLVMDTEVEGGPRVRFSDVCVSGPVVCACVRDQQLYYSTGSDLLQLDLSARMNRRSEQEEKEGMRKDAAGLQSPRSLNVCRVAALVGHPCDTDAGKVQLLGLSSRGQLQTITLPTTVDAALKTSDVGKSVRDLLSAIGDVCERASALKTSIRSKKETLRRLNQVLNISFLLSQDSDVRDGAIRCDVRTGWSRSLQEDRLDLTCVLVNGSPFELQQGWTLTVTLFAPCCSPGGSSSNFSFPFHGLRPGEELEVSLPLAASEAGIPVTVHCSLVFSLTSLLEEAELRQIPDLKTGGLSLPLNSETVDWLHTLQTISDTVASRTRVDPVQAFIHSQQNIKNTSVCEEKKMFSASLQVSTDLLRETILKSSDPLESAPAALLDWLLHGSVAHPGGRAVAHARAHNVHTLTLSAKEVQASEEKECLVAVELQVESSSMAAVCGLHHAVLSRLQSSLQTSHQTVISSRKIQTSCLRRALQRAEQLLLQTQQSRTSEGSGSTESTSRSLLRVYGELREKPLLIV